MSLLLNTEGVVVETAPLEIPGFVPIPNSPDESMMCQTIVTFDLYDQYCVEMGHDFPSDSNWGRGKQPVIFVNCFDAMMFCNWMSLKLGVPPKYILFQPTDEDNVVYLWLNPNAVTRKNSPYKAIIGGVEQRIGSVSLPSSEEWERAAKIPKPDNPNEYFAFAGSDVLDEVAWYADNSDSHTHPVGKKKPTPYWDEEKKEFDWSRPGVYDLFGNTWEWMEPEGIDYIDQKVWKQFFGDDEPYLNFRNIKKWCPQIEL